MTNTVETIEMYQFVDGELVLTDMPLVISDTGFESTIGYTKAAALFEKYGFMKTDMHYMNWVDKVREEARPEMEEDLTEFYDLYPNGKDADFAAALAKLNLG